MSKSAAPKLPIGWHFNGDEDDPEFTHDKIKGKFTQLWLAEKTGGTYWSFSDKMRLNSKPAGGKDVGIIDSSGAIVGADGAVKAAVSSGATSGIAPAKKWGAAASVSTTAAPASKTAPSVPVVAALRVPAGWDKIISGTDTWFVNKTSSATCWFLFIQDSFSSYYNCITGETTSTRPDAGEGSGIEIVDELGNPASIDSTAGGASAASTLSTTTSSETAELPEGWSEQTSEDGSVFYYNSVTGDTSWDRPAATETETAGTTEIPAVGEQQVTAHGDLPAGWSEEKAEDGAVFYFNSANGETSWDRPNY